jgi:hypothetical protein
MASECGTTTVVSSFSEGNVSVRSCANPPNEVQAGEQFRVDYEVENTNDQPASVTVAITATDSSGGSVVLEEATFTLDGNYWQGRYSTPPAPTTAGEYTISVEVASASEA